MATEHSEQFSLVRETSASKWCLHQDASSSWGVKSDVLFLRGAPVYCLCHKMWGIETQAHYSIEYYLKLIKSFEEIHQLIVQIFKDSALS